MTNQKRKTGLARLMELAGPKKFELSIACILSVLASAIRLIPYIMIYEVLKLLIVYYSDNGAFSKERLSYCIIFSFLSAILYGVCSYFSSIVAHNAAFDILYELRMALMKKMGKLSAGYYNTSTQGGLKKLLVEDVEQIETFVAHNLCEVITAIATPLFTLIILFVINWKLTLVSLIPILLSMIILMLALMKPKGAQLQKEMAERKTNLEGTVVEYIHGMPVIKIFGRTTDSFKRFSQDLSSFTDKVKETAYYNANGMGLYYAFFGAQILFLLPAAIIMIKNSPSYIQTIPTILFFLLVGSGLKEPLENMMVVSVDSKKINTCIERIDSLLDEEEIRIIGNGRSITSFDIDFKSVEFSYKADNESKDLSNVSFHLEAGTCTALVGPSGGGKSTIAKLLLHFYEPQSGSILIGNTNINEIPIEELVNKIAYVFQDSFIFTDTIENNIRMGNTSATMEDIKSAAKAANISETIEALPNGYQTMVGSEMGGLSGGEKQRIAIARAILKNAPIVILDEATAYADAENETKIQDAFRNLSKGKTVIMIAHRLKSIQNSDRILVMNDGILVGNGTHAQLYADCPIYQKMVDTNDRSLNWSMNSKEVS